MRQLLINYLFVFVALFIILFNSCKEKNKVEIKSKISSEDSLRNIAFKLLEEHTSYSHYLKDSSNNSDTVLLIQRKNKSPLVLLGGFFEGICQAFLFEINNSKLEILDSVSYDGPNNYRFYLMNSNDTAYFICHLFFAGGSMGNNPQNILVFDLGMNNLSNSIGEFEYDFGEVSLNNNNIFIKSDRGVREIKIQNNKAEFAEIIPFKTEADIPEGYTYITIFQDEKSNDLSFEVMGKQKSTAKIISFEPHSNSAFDSLLNDRSFLEIDINNTIIINNKSGGSCSIHDPYDICIINNKDEKYFKLNPSINLYDNFKGIKVGKCGIQLSRWEILPIKFINSSK